MKKFTKFLTIALVISLCIGAISPKYASAKSKNIYFAGEYRKKLGKKEWYVFQLNQYSSPEGKIVGNYAMFYYYEPAGGMHRWGEGEIKRVGTNKYKIGKIKLRIYKKKLILKNAGEYNGTYKLKKRYPRP